MTFVVARTDCFKYFCEQLNDDDWRGKAVLDFGGSNGGLISDPDTTIDEDRYWCIDIVEQAIALGRADHPKAHWLFYDRYSFYYNPRGIPALDIPDPGERFDIIAAYSVFTSTGPAEMLKLVAQLETLLAPGGRLAFTFIDPHFHSWPATYPGNNLQWRLEKQRSEGAQIDVPALLARARGASWCSLLNDTDLYVDNEEIPSYPLADQRTSHVYYTTERMAALFPGATIRPPANHEMQHCCILHRP